jgi:hypothetical protein
MLACNKTRTISVSREISSQEEESLNEMLFNASVSETNNDFEQAATQLLQALTFARRTFGEKSLHVANALHRIASFYSRREKYFSAKPYIEELMNIMSYPRRLND